MTEVKRAVRVAGRVREEIAWLITQEARDPRLAGVTVSRVEMPDDLSAARIYVRLLDPARREEALEGLARASGMLRRELAKRIKLRHAPTLRFVYDDGQDKADRIEELLREVAKERG